MTFMKKASIMLFLTTFSVTAFAGTKIQSVFLNGGNAGGGATFFGSVNLTAPAGHGGAVVTVTSSDTSVMTCPASITVPEGSTYADLFCDSYAVAQPMTVTLTGTYKGTATFNMTVYPAMMRLVQASPSPLPGGTPGYVYILMNGRVATDTVFMLSSDNPSVVQVPSSVTMPAGAGSGCCSFFSWDGLTTSPVTTQQVVTVTATQILWNGYPSMMSGTMIVNP